MSTQHQTEHPGDFRGQEYADRPDGDTPSNENKEKLKDDNNDAPGDYGSSLKDKVKQLASKLNPVSPTARSDLHIMKHSLTVESHVKREIHNAHLHPEVTKVATIRRGLDLCTEEANFVTARKLKVRNYFAKYLGLDPSEVHPDDIPTVSFGGSGGGFRAMIGMVGYCGEMRKAGLWDLLTYVSGVSGACWSLAAYYTFGNANWDEIIEHYKRRLSPYHPLSSEAMRAVLSAPGGIKQAVGPLVTKQQSGLHLVAMDLYSVFTSGHLFLHEKEQKPEGVAAPDVIGFRPEWFKWSSAQRYLTDGSQPMPIFTAIRHERPWKDWPDKEHPFKEDEYDSKEHSDATDAWFQWFEMTPYEVGCDEVEGWVPIWGFGRPFEQGKSTMQLPEHSLALLLGLCTSAPAGPMTSYLATVKRNLPAGFIGNQIHNVAHAFTKLWGKQGTEVFEQHHPLHACNEHNFLYHLTPDNPSQPRPPGLENSPRIHLIDSGMDNNCPTYVLLHPSRNTDVIINMDASSDVQKDSFQQRVDQIGGRRGIKFTKHSPNLKADPNTSNPQRFKGLYAQIYDGVTSPRTPTVVDSYGNTVTTPPAPTVQRDCTMVYMPLLPNEAAVKDYDPSTAKFSGSYNLIWTPEQIEMLVNVCIGNFREGEGTVKVALREAWEQRREVRLSGGGRGSGGEGGGQGDGGGKAGAEYQGKSESGVDVVSPSADGKAAVDDRERLSYAGVHGQVT